MSDSRPWTEYQDKILKIIRDEEGIQKWSTIAQKMAQQYNIKGRNGKQCKQRYMQVFDVNNQVFHWDYQSQQKMFVLHDQIGNKWAAIGQQLQNRTDNDVKNHFYSKIRKGLRKINKVIKDHLNKKQFKEIKPTVLYKIIQAAQDRFASAHMYEEDVRNFCVQAKNTLLMMSYDQMQYNQWNDYEANHEIIKEFIQNLSFFSKQFKRKPKSNIIISGRIIESAFVANALMQNKQLLNQQKPPRLEAPNLYGSGSSLLSPYSMKQEGNSMKGQSICCDSELDNEIDNSQFDDSQFQDMQKTTNKNFLNGSGRLNLPLSQCSLIYSPNNNNSNNVHSKKQRMNPVIILKSSNQLADIMIEQKNGNMNMNSNGFQSSAGNSYKYSPTHFNNHTSSIQKRHNEEVSPHKKKLQLLPNIPKLIHTSSKVRNAMMDEEYENMNIIQQSNNNNNNNNCENENIIENQLMRQGLLEQDNDQIIGGRAQNAIFSGGKNITSKGSNFSSYSIQQEQEVQFFDEDSALNMRIFTTGNGGKITYGIEQSLEKSGKLFKSVDRGQQLFESIGGRSQNGRMKNGDMEMSIQQKSQLGNSFADKWRQNSLFQSMGI